MDASRFFAQADGAGPRTAFAHWLTQHLPEPLLRQGFKGLAWWQWLALGALVVAALVAGRFLSWITRRGLSFLARRTRFTWDDQLVQGLRGPLTLGWATVALLLTVGFLGLSPEAAHFVRQGVSTLFLVAFFWSLARGVTLLAQALRATPWAFQHPASRSLVPLGARLARVGVASLGAVAILAQLGYPVASLIAGLGIGGIALALAAQKTVENLFGAFSLGLDQPFRHGDFIKVEDVQGEVESVGLRSTRVRTLDRTVVTIPNGKLAEMRIETFAERDRIRFFTELGLVYGTTATQMREVLEALERALRAHPKIWPDNVIVRFKRLGAYSLDVEISAWFLTTDWNEFTILRQELLLQTLEIVERAGTSLAFPTQAVVLQPEFKGPAPKREAAG